MVYFLKQILHLIGIKYVHRLVLIVTQFQVMKQYLVTKVQIKINANQVSTFNLVIKILTLMISHNQIKCREI